MSRQTFAIATTLSVLALGSPLISSCMSFTRINTNPLRDGSFNSGVEKAEAGNYQGAIADFSRAIEINAQDDDAYYNRGVVKDKLKNYQGAIADYSKAIEINPQNALAYSNRCLLYTSPSPRDS